MLGPEEIAGCIIAGGLSRRMEGRDKSLLPLAGRPMIAHVIGALSPQVNRLLINANGPAERFSAFALPVVPDPIEGHLGPLAGVLAGLQWLRETAPELTYMVTASADAPLIPRDLVSRLAATISPGRCEIAMASSAGKLHPVIALWPVARADDLQEALAGGTRKVLNWTDKHVVHEVPFEPRVLGTTEVDPFFNANTPEDLERLDTLVLSGTR